MYAQSNHWRAVDLGELRETLDIVCDTATSNLPAYTRFFEHEQVYSPPKLRSTESLRNVETFLMRVVASYGIKKVEEQAESPSAWTHDALQTPSYSVAHIGGADASKARRSTVRPFLRVATDKDPSHTAQQLGFKFSFELVRRGYRYYWGDKLYIDVFQVYRLQERNELNMLEPFNPDYWILEVRSPLNPYPLCATAPARRRAWRGRWR